MAIFDSDKYIKLLLDSLGNYNFFYVLVCQYKDRIHSYLIIINTFY